MRGEDTRLEPETGKAINASEEIRRELTSISNDRIVLVTKRNGFTHKQAARIQSLAGPHKLIDREGKLPRRQKDWNMRVVNGSY